MYVRHPFAALLVVVFAHGAAAAQDAAPDSLRTLRSARNAVSAHVRTLRTVTGLSRGIARESRPRLIARLDALAERSPRDEWIVGNQVGVRVIHGDLDVALRTARECLSTRWWCDALTGFVHHVRSEFAEAEAAFDRALAAMPEEERCAWLREIPEHLLSGDFAREFARADCDRQGELEERLWWLADPLHMLPGNDRRTEHYARLVAMRLHHEWLHLDGSSCSSRHHLTQIRQGWPEWWWSPESRTTELLDGPGYRFIPASEVVLAPLESVAGDWGLSGGIQDERYDPSYGPFHPLDQQAAFFDRGDSVAVLAATDLGRHPLIEAGEVDVAVILSRDEREPPILPSGEAFGDRYFFRTMAPAGRYLVSVEALTPDDGAARTRFGHGLSTGVDGRPMLSDLLLWDWREGIDEDLEAVAPRMLGTTRVPRNRSLGVFWEMYGLPAGETVDVELRVVPGRGGFLRRVARTLRLVGPRESLRFVWTEGLEDDGAAPVGRTLELDLSVLPTGEYTLELGIRSATREAVARRPITLVDGDD